ncbi:MAG: hypothetical protein CFE28_15450 [Alphaproteobacteria bacterium PA2]|nr:MAG: hypothetical protein CFE28_15450 [Alphaproteobacteria bacterium PA2]
MFRRSAPDATPPPSGETAPRPRRWGLYGPYIALAIAVALWSGAWLTARSEVIRRMDSLVASFEASGHHLQWSQRTVGGYPFRLSVVVTDFKGQAPGGWGVESRRLEAEAFMHAPGHWVLAAPEGLTLLRPAGGPVDITGTPIHASLHGLAVRPPSFSLEGLDLRFTGREKPFVLSGADKFELHLRPGPDRQGAILFRLTNGRANPPGLLGRIAGNQPVNLELEAILSRADALKGPGWSRAVRAWAAAGGRANLRSARASAGSAMIEAKPGELSLSQDGRLAGQINVTLRKAPEALSDLTSQGVIPGSASAGLPPGSDPAAQATLTFKDGATFLGQIPIGPAPRLF